MDDEVCRICLTETGAMKWIFSVDGVGQTIRLCDMIMSFTNTKILEDDGLPFLICTQCVNQVHNAYTFKLLCEYSDQVLRKKQAELEEAENECIVLSNEMSESSDEDISILPFEENACIEISAENITDEVQSNAGEINSNGIIDAENPTENKCDICDETFNFSAEQNKNSLEMHMKMHREQQHPFSCNVCHKKFIFMKNYNSHMKLHLKPYECKTCGRRFRKTRNLLHHKIYHIEKASFKCVRCDTWFNTARSLTRHLRIHHSVQFIDSEIEDPNLENQNHTSENLDSEYFVEYARTEPEENVEEALPQFETVHMESPQFQTIHVEHGQCNDGIIKEEHDISLTSVKTEDYKYCIGTDENVES